MKKLMRTMLVGVVVVAIGIAVGSLSGCGGPSSSSEKMEEKGGDRMSGGKMGDGRDKMSGDRMGDGKDKMSGGKMGDGKDNKMGAENK